MNNLSSIFYFVRDLLDNYETIELSSAPHSYFVAVDREQIVERAKKTDIDEIIPDLKSISKNKSNELASFLFTPGSDLPTLKPDEVEIARIIVETTIGNCYSLRAEWNDTISYRIVSEISGLTIEVPIKNSNTPLTLEEVILQFESAIPAVGLNDLAYELSESDDEDAGEYYISAASAYYSGFNQFYQYASLKLIQSLNSK